MNNRYLDEIFAEYDRRRQEAEEKASERKLEIYKRIPRIKEIDAELSNIGLDIARSIFRKDISIEEVIKQKKQYCTNLKVEKAELMTKNNFPQDYMEPKYSCSICKDTGYVGSEKCRCLKQRIIDKYYDQSNLREAIKSENFEMFVFDYYSPHKFGSEILSPRKNIEEIFKACINFTANFDNISNSLFFYGNTGLGKTFLSNCIAKDLLDKGKLVVYQTISNLIDILKAAKFENGGNTKSNKIDDIFDCELLIIDDLGTEYITEFTQMELFNIINGRLLAGKKMLISTNLSLEQIMSTYSERITSRIFGNFSIYKFYGDDIRLKIAQEKRKKSKGK